MSLTLNYCDKPSIRLCDHAHLQKGLSPLLSFLEKAKKEKEREETRKEDSFEKYGTTCLTILSDK